MSVDWIWWLGQTVGILGLLLGINAFRQKLDIDFKKHMVVFCIVESCHFAIMSAWSACFGCLLNGCRAFASIKTRSKTVMWIFLLVLWSVGILSLVGFNINLIVQTYKSSGICEVVSILLKEPYRLFPILGSTIGTVGLFLLSGIRLRATVFICSFLWLIHNLIVVSIGPSIMELCFLYMNFRTIRKLMREQRKQESTK